MGPLAAAGLLALLCAALVVRGWQSSRRRLRAEQELAAERQLLRAFLESTTDQVYFKDLESRFVRVSGVQAAKLNFASPEAAVGKSDFDAFSQAHATRALEEERRIIATGEPIVDLEQKETFADGREAWVSTAKMPLRDENGRIIGTFGVTRDITHRKRAEVALRESEERWRTLLASLQELVLVLDGDGVLQYATPSVELWLGYHPESLLGTRLADASHPDDSAALKRALADVAPARPLELAHRLGHIDGSWRSFESTLVCLRADPSSRAVLMASRDVTERAALAREREELELERRVSHRLEAVGQLAAGIAHEIDAPLQFVGDSVAFLREAARDLLALIDAYRDLLTADADAAREAEDRAGLRSLRERVPAALERALDGIERVRSIVLAMKRFSHPADKDAAPADLNDAIETTLTLCRNEYAFVADVHVDLGPLPAVVCHVGELNQVFLNLVVNAAQAIEEQVAGTGERGEIRITTRRDGDEVVVEVADNGPGIPPELVDRIWEPFFTTRQAGEGGGHGLALARTIVERHRGTLRCTSAPGHGSSFTIRLPLEARDIAEAA